MNEDMMNKMRKKGISFTIKTIYDFAIKSVHGQNIIEKIFKIKNNKKILIKNQEFNFKKIYLIGFGKAVLGMAEKIEKIAHQLLIKGIISVPYGSVETLKPYFNENSKIEILECAENNLPDLKSCENTKLIQNLVRSLDENDLLIVLISGGGSACLSLPQSPLTLEEKLETIKLLVRSGADIKELNKVRKKLSAVKGGQLAIQGYPATIVSLIISDVVGDPLSDIASGPTVLNQDGWDEAKNIILKYKLQDQVSSNVLSLLNTRSQIQQNINQFKNVHNFIVGNNNLALEQAKLQSEMIGYRSLILSDSIEGLGTDICEIYIELVKCIIISRRLIANDRNNIEIREEAMMETLEPILQRLNVSQDKVQNLCKMLSIPLNLCLISGGEITWDMTNASIGKGGRNLHLTLLFQYKIEQLFQELFDIFEEESSNFGIFFSSCGTDGIDGVTDVAGSIASSLDEIDLDVVKTYLDRFDSYNYYSDKPDDLIKPGHTGTNVMDIHVLIIRESSVN